MAGHSWASMFQTCASAARPLRSQMSYSRALAWVPATVSQNSRLRRPTQNGRMAFSTTDAASMQAEDDDPEGAWH